MARAKENRSVGAIADAIKLDETAAAQPTSAPSAALPPEEKIPLPEPEIEEAVGSDGESVDLSAEFMQSLGGAGPMRPPALTKEERALAKEKAKEEAKLIPPSLKRLGALASKLPGAEHIKVHKRDEKTGQTAYIASYGIRDLQHHKGIEEFVHAYLKPTWGHGEYIITAVSAHGQTIEAGSVLIAKPEEEPTMQPGTTPMDVIKTLIEKNQQPPLGGARGPAADPIEQMQKLEELRAKLGERAGAEAGGMSTLVATIIQTSAQQNQMMMQMMKDNAERGEDRMMQLMAAMKGSDSTTPLVMGLLTTMISKMFEQKVAENALAPFSPLPAPVAPVSPTTQLKEMAEIIALLNPPRQQDDRITQFLLQNQVGFKDALELVKNNTAITPAGGLKEAMEQVQGVLGLAMQLKNAQEPGASSGFWDALQTLFSNRALGEGLSGFLKERRAPALPANNAVDMEVALNQQADRLKQQRILEARQRLELEARLLEAERRQPARLVPPPDAEATPETAPAPAAPQQPAASAPTPAPTAPQQPAASAPPPAPRKRLAMPNGIEEPINLIVLATDDEKRVEAMIKLFEFLGKDEDWKNYSIMFFKNVTSDNKDGAMTYVKGVLEAFVNLQILDVEIAQKSHDAFESAFSDVAEYVKQQLEAAGEEDDEDDEGEEEEDGAEEEETAAES